MIWKTLILVTGSESPVRYLHQMQSHCYHKLLLIVWAEMQPNSAVPRCMLVTTTNAVQVVVVLSGSMEPGFYRGDILFLNMGHQPIRVGEVVVFNIDDRDIPIVHRVIKVHEKQPGGEVDVLTKASRPCSVWPTCRISAAC